MKEQLEKLAEEFPERFECHPGLFTFWFDGRQGMGVTVQSKSDRALFHACLVDLVEEAGLKLYVDPHGWWMDDPDKIGPLSRADCDTALSAVLAAAPEIKRRLEETHATD